MIRRKGRCGILLTLLLTLYVLPGCVLTDKPMPMVPTVGVADWDAVMQAHPLYGTYVQKKQRLESKRWLAWGTYGRLQLPENISNAVTANSNGASLANESLRRADGRMQSKVQEQLLKATAENKIQQCRTRLEAEDEPRLLNLKLRESMLTTARDAAQAAAQPFSRTAELLAVQQEIATVLQEREERFRRQKGEIEQNTERALLALREKMELQRTTSSAAEKVQLTEMTRSMQPETTTTIADESELAGLEQEAAALEQQIRQDVEGAAAEVAQRKGLETIITKMTMYFSTIDCSEEIIAELAKK